MKADQLNDKLQHRPDPETLVKEGVLHEDPRKAKEEAEDRRVIEEAREAERRQAERDAEYEERMEDEYAKREGGA